VVRKGAFPPTVERFESATYFSVERRETKTIVISSLHVTSSTIAETIIIGDAGLDDDAFRPDRSYMVYCAARSKEGSRVRRSTQAEIDGTGIEIVAQIYEPSTFFVASGIIIAQSEYTARGLDF
jgi:hypothetical protein